MVPEIISFSKSMSCRLLEFENLLSDVETPCSEIKEVWASIFHDLVVTNCGWQGLWILSEESCTKYDLMHPTAVIVTVDSYDWDDMYATVTVTAVQDDIILPSMLDVPVIELHPIKNQEYDEDDLKIIADWLDKCRYFFKYLWYPWDAKINMKLSQWCESHLKSRLQIQCNIQNGVFDKRVVSYYNSLVAESRKIDAALTQVNVKELSSDQRVDTINNCIRRKVLKMELSFFEEPDLRNDLILLRQGPKEPSSAKTKKEAKLIWEGGPIDSLLLYLSTVKSVIDNEVELRISPSIQEALDSSSSGDLILLPPGFHYLKSLSYLGSGGAIRGFSNPHETNILAHSLGTRKAILLECFGDLEIQNVTLSRVEGIAVQVFEKTLRISNCRIISRKSALTRGITVLSGCTLLMENCEISGFRVGVAMQKGAKAFISKTRIIDCFAGIKVSEETELSLNEVEISNCSECAMRLESSKIDSAFPLTGNLDLLSNLNGDFTINFQSLNLKDNKKCDILLGSNMDNFPSDEFDTSHETIIISDEDIADCSID